MDDTIHAAACGDLRIESESDQSHRPIAAGGGAVESSGVHAERGGDSEGECDLIKNQKWSLDTCSCSLASAAFRPASLPSSANCRLTLRLASGIRERRL